MLILGGIVMLSQRLKSARTRSKLTQEELAAKVNTTKGTISNYENGHSTPSNEMLVLLSDALDISTDYLLGRTEKYNVGDDTTTNYKISFHQAAQINEILGRKKITSSNFRNELGMSEDEYFEFRGGNDFRITENQAKTIEKILGIPKEKFKILSSEVIVAGKEISLSEEDLLLFNELKKHPIMFHDLASDPEKKVKELIRLYKMKQMFLEEDEEEYEDGFGELED